MEIEGVPALMAAVVLTGHGGFDRLEYRTDIPVPRPQAGEVLIRVGAAGVNNTDINTRIGWYSKSLRSPTTADVLNEPPTAAEDDGGWEGIPLAFPRIQGADACGHIVSVGAGVNSKRIGQRVIVATMQQAPSGTPFATVTLGSEMDGAFAQYLVTRSSEAFAVVCDWTDVELASLPCASSTAENMLQRIDVNAADRVLITGASGGVGTSAVQLAKRRGAHVVAVAAAAKAGALRDLGADEVVNRGDDLTEVLGDECVDVVVDLVAGPSWSELLRLLRRGGRYVCSGAIAGPIVELDVRTLYLKDLTLCGATYQEPGVFRNLVRYVERGEIRSVVHSTYPLADIVRAQTDFLAKDFVGKLVLVPPHP